MRWGSWACVRRAGCGGGDGLSGDVGECGYAQVDGGGAVSGDLVHLVELVFGGGAAEGEAVHVPGPAVGGGFGDPGRQVVADLRQPGASGRVRAQQRAAGVLVDAASVVGTAAGAQ